MGLKLYHLAIFTLNKLRTSQREMALTLLDRTEVGDCEESQSDAEKQRGAWNVLKQDGLTTDP